MGGAWYYTSKFGVWLSVDPLASKYPGLSPYNYCLNNPLNAVDPDGRNPFILVKGAEALFVATVAVTVATLHTVKYATDRSYRERIDRAGQSAGSLVKQALTKLDGALAKPNASENAQAENGQKAGDNAASEQKEIDWANAPPANPEALGEEWEETTSEKNKSGNHREFTNKETGETVKYDKGTPGAKGNKGKDHWHRNNPNSSGNKDQNLDKNGNPCRRGSPESHIVVNN